MGLVFVSRLLLPLFQDCQPGNEVVLISMNNKFYSLYKVSICCIHLHACYYTSYISVPRLSLVGGEPGYEATSCLTPLANAYKDTYQHKNSTHPVLVCNCPHKLKCRLWTGFCFLSHQPPIFLSTRLFHIFEPRPPLQRGKVKGGLGTSFTWHSKSFKATKCP